MLLTGRVIVVSGVGPGLGRALALACADHGADVVLVSRTQERLDDVAREVEARDVRALTVCGDAGDPEHAARVAAAAVTTFGRIDGLVNNAAVIPPLEAIGEVPATTLQESMAGNFATAFELTRAVLPTMHAQRSGAVVMIASAVFRHPKPGFGAYNVAKHAMIGLARSLALELGPSGIRVNTLAPGKIAGERLERYFGERAASSGHTVAEVREEYVGNIALRRLPAAEEYADAAVFLLSDLSRAVTGHVLDANGGEYFD